MILTFDIYVYLTIGMGLWGKEGIGVRVGRLEENKLNGSYLPHLF